jgi:transcriptional antiterminator RfaH
VRSLPKKERLASEVLRARHGLEVFCPQIRFRRKTVRGPIWFQEAMFPGYFFAKMDFVRDFRLVSASTGVMNLPAFNGRPVVVPDSVIDSIREELSEEAVADAELPLKVGEETTILSGALQGLQVKVVRLMPARQRVAVLMELLGTLVEAEFPVSELEREKRHPMMRK